MTLLDFLNRIKVSIRGPKFKKASEKALKANENSILQKLRAYSPVDTGHFKSRWRVSLKRFSGSSNDLAELYISNDTEGYGQFMETGAEPLGAPWYFPHRVRRGKKRGQFKKGTGKLKLVDGKVWAGGLKPGHNVTVGGVMQNVFSKRSNILDRLTIDVSNSVIKVFL